MCSSAISGTATWHIKVGSTLIEAEHEHDPLQGFGFFAHSLGVSCTRPAKVEYVAIVEVISVKSLVRCWERER
jgi:hypothetical protein